MENSPAYWIGRSMAALLFAIPALIFIILAFRPNVPSLRLANAALFCGLMAFCLPELALGLKPSVNTSLFRAIGMLRLGFAVSGLALAVLAFVRRWKDHGAGLVRLLLASGLSVLHLSVGGFYLLLTSSLFAIPSTTDIDSADSTAWTYHYTQYDVELRLPTSQWREAKMRDGRVMFVHRLPQMQANTLSVQRGWTQAEFQSEVEKLRKIMANDPKSRPTLKERNGMTEEGDPYFYITGISESDNGTPIFVASSIVWCKAKELVVHVVFEGLYSMRSEIGKNAETDTFGKSAEFLCLSVK